MARRVRGPQTFAVISRADYGGPGFRKWMLDAFATIHTWESFRFVVIQGGLVSAKALLGPLPKGEKARKEAYGILVERSAQDLAALLPALRGENDELVKYYIFTSPAPQYDGTIGAEIARRLTELRSEDVKYEEETSGRLELKGLRDTDVLRVVLPSKGVAQLGGVVNYSVRPSRFIREKRKQSPQLPPALWSSDCGGTSIVRPAGEIQVPWMTAPMLSRPMETITTENQVGIRVVEYTPSRKNFVFRNYSLKDLMMRERESIPVPEGLSRIQRLVFQQLKRSDLGPRYIGQLEDALYVSRANIEAALAEYAASGFEPAILQDPTNKRYDFDQKWIQRNVRITLPEIEKLLEDRLVAFACLHAGSSFMEDEFFTGRVTELILETGATVLVGAGDLVEGLKHNLARRGEIVPGFESYTFQEELAADLVGEVVLRVFRQRLNRALATPEGEEISAADIQEAVRASLLWFFFRKGNHDDWQTEDGHEPLVHFRTCLTERVLEGILSELRTRGVRANHIRELVEEHIVEAEKIKLPSSGLPAELFHPYKARMKAESGRAQEMLEASDCPVVIGGNFHVAVAVDEWDPKIGQRVALQVGTIVWQTKFEKNLLKKLDVGVGYLRTKSLNGRIFMSEVQFVGDKVKNPQHTPEKARQAYYREIGLRQV